MRISARPAAAALVSLLLLLPLASCTPGSGEPAAHPCGLGADSREDALVREVLARESYETQVLDSTSALAKTMEQALPSIGPKKTSFGANACAYKRIVDLDIAHMVLVAGWVLRGSEGRPYFDDVAYELNGVRGLTNIGVSEFGLTTASRSNLLIPCDLPGKLAARSRKVWLEAELRYTFSPRRLELDQAAKDSRMTLTYLLARRVTDALGCENQPLAKPPVVEPLPAPARADAP
ncbi:hypothetical protein [Streptomyces sp. TBY4]|uniref:hypothetical protein n=1 Tax=Streptomyces sp. TBY4 TaxID=2962030 RepID=UPI0020B77ED1|nr:hypothetical protein [Streptomyces sp. TBY4]MCP3756142.1 hypothetical protein [Streptomyces sp. TBY4]